MGGSDPNPPPNPNPPTGDPPPCPSRVVAILPRQGDLAEGDALEVVYEAGPPARAVLYTPSGVLLGPVAGAPELSRFLTCLREGVAYSARVERVTGAALTCVLTLAAG